MWESGCFSHRDGRPGGQALESAESETGGSWEWGCQEREPQVWRIDWPRGATGQEGLQARAWGHSGLHCPPAMVFLWPQIRGSPDVKRKACHPLPPGCSCPEAALCIPSRPPLPNSHWGPASCLPGPQSGSHRYTQNNPRGSLHTSDARCLCWALSFLLHRSLCVPVPGGITSHSHARPAWLLSLPTRSFHHLHQSYRRPRVTRVNHR